MLISVDFSFLNGLSFYYLFPISYSMCVCLCVSSSWATFTFIWQHLCASSICYPVSTGANRPTICTRLLSFHESTRWFITACSLEVIHTHTQTPHSPTLKCLFSTQRGSQCFGMCVTLCWLGGGRRWDLLDLQGKLYSAHDTLKKRVFIFHKNITRWYLGATAVKNRLEEESTWVVSQQFNDCSTIVIVLYVICVMIWLFLEKKKYHQDKKCETL